MIFSALELKGQSYSFKQYTTDDGLPTNYVYGVIEDDEGFIWAYTENGISKFDGYSFKNYNVQDGLASNDVFYMTKDVKGTIWIQDGSGQLSYIKNDSIKAIDLENSKAIGVNPINGIIKYVISDRRDRLKIKHSEVMDGAIINTVNIDSLCNALGIKHSDVRWYANEKLYTETKLYDLSGDDGEVISLTADWLTLVDMSNIICMVLEDKCFAYDKQSIGVYDYKDGQFLEIKWDDFFKDFSECSFTDNGDVLTVSTNRGFIEFDKELNVVDHKAFKSLADQYFLKRSFKDSQGNLWIGSREGGLFFMNRAAQTTTVLKPQKVFDNTFIHLQKTSSNELLVFSDNANVYKLSNDVLHPIYTSPNESKLNNVGEGPDKSLVMYETQGTKLLDKDDKVMDLTHFPFFYKFGFKSKVGFDFSTKLTNLKGGALFVENEYWMTSNFGTFLNVRHSDGHFTTYEYEGKVKHFFYDPHSERTFLSDADKLFEIGESYEKKSFLSLKLISSFFPVDNNTYLLGTESGGLYLYDLNSKELVHLSDYKFIRQILPFNNGFLLATNEGVVSCHLEDQEFHLDYIFSKKDGLPTNEIYGVEFINDALYCCTIEGLVKMPIDQVSMKVYGQDQNFLKNELNISELLINGNSYNLSQDLNFPCHENDIDIIYNLIDYSSEGKIAFEYKIEPIEDEWQLTHERQVSFRNLQANNYTFKLRAYDSFGNIHELSAPLKFKVKKAFWQTLWFYVLLITLLVLVNYLIVKSNSDKNKILIERNRIDQKLSDLQLRFLRSQMNPHFVFNSLGAIQYYVQTHKTKEADNYLTMFAKLMRRYLDSSIDKTISLRNELSLLKDYTQLEMMRFESKFSTSFNIDKQLDLDRILIPSMLIQPYVENAINHGLTNRKDNNGILIIDFNAIGEDDFRCTIKDNGVGRFNSLKLKKSKYVSRGMKNVNERIEALKEEGLYNVNVEMSDLSNDIEFPGTQVTLNIKIKKFEHESNYY